MIRDFVVDELYESSFDGGLLVDIIEMLQQASDKYGKDASMSINYDCDNSIEFSIVAPREETKFEADLRVQHELYEQQVQDQYERKEYQRLKEKYGV